MKVTETLRTATLDDTPEAYVVCAVGFGHVYEVIETFPTGPEGGKAAVDRVAELRAAPHRAGEKTLAAYAVVHDCDAHAVPYVSDGPLGHGWECGRCGKFLQAG